MSAEAPPGQADWIVGFLEALAGEAINDMEMLRSLERGWIAARARVPAQRGTSRAVLAVDVMAATPLISPTTLAKAIGMSIKCTTDLLDRFVVSGIAVEVTHRSARRLFSLAAVAPVRAAAAKPWEGTGAAPVGRSPRSVGCPDRAAAPDVPLSAFTDRLRRAGGGDGSLQRCDTDHSHWPPGIWRHVVLVG